MTMSIATALEQAKEFDTRSMFAQKRKAAFRLLKDKDMLHVAFPATKSRTSFEYVSGRPTLPQTWLTPMLQCSMKR